MKYIVIFRNDLEIIEADSDDVLFGENEELSLDEWKEIDKSVEVGVTVVYDGKPNSAVILQVIVNELDDTTETIKMLRQLQVEKNAKIPKLLLKIERIKYSKRFRFPAFSTISTDVSSDCATGSVNTGGAQFGVKKLFKQRFTTSSSPLLKELPKLPTTSSNNYSTLINKETLTTDDSTVLKSTNIMSPDLHLRAAQRSKFSGTQSEANTWVPMNTGQFNSSVENDAKQYVQSRGCQWHTIEGLFELQLLQFKELAKIKVEIAALSTEKKNVLSVDSITARKFLPLRDVAKLDYVKLKLQTETIRTDVIKVLRSVIVTTSCRKTIKNIVDELISGEMQSKFNRTGSKDPRNKDLLPKLSFDDIFGSILFETIADAFKKSEVNRCVQNYFADARKRKGKEKKQILTVSSSSSDIDN